VSRITVSLLPTPLFFFLREGFMINDCFNPACRAEFRSLSGGDLYALERRSADTEF